MSKNEQDEGYGEDIRVDVDDDVVEMEEFNQLTKSAHDTSDWMDDLELQSVEAPSENPVDPRKQYTHAKMWAMNGTVYTPCEKAVDTLPEGQFTIDHDPHRGIYFEKKKVELDDLLELPDSASEQVIAEIQDFWQKEF